MTSKQAVLSKGFASPVFDSQACFRTILEAMSSPGRILSMPVKPGCPSGLNISTVSVCLTLADLDTPLWLDAGATTSEIKDYLQFHCGLPIVSDPKQAAFALGVDLQSFPALSSFHPGTPEYPDRSATLFLQVEGLQQGQGVTFSGPGIKSTHRLSIQGLPAGFWEQWSVNRSCYPLGVDILFVCGDLICGLPRTTKVEWASIDS